MRLGLARIYEARGEAEKALKYYYSVFFLYDHPVMAAEALLRALYLEPAEASRKQLFGELRKRFPAALALPLRTPATWNVAGPGRRGTPCCASGGS